MTKEELTKENAIFLLKQVNEILINSNSWLENTHEPLNQAFDMAIKALEQQSDDCVSRQAIDHLCFEYLRPNTDDNIAFYEHFCDLPPVTPTQRWIPVSERLPKKNMPCLVSVGSFNLTQIAIYSDLMHTIDHKIFYEGDYGHDSFMDITKYVKAWMPLPKPYEEKRGSENV